MTKRDDLKLFFKKYLRVLSTGETPFDYMGGKNERIDCIETRISGGDGGGRKMYCLICDRYCDSPLYSQEEAIEHIKKHFQEMKKTE